MELVRTVTPRKNIKWFSHCSTVFVSTLSVLISCYLRFSAFFLLFIVGTISGSLIYEITLWKRQLSVLVWIQSKNISYAQPHPNMIYDSLEQFLHYPFQFSPTLTFCGTFQSTPSNIKYNKLNALLICKHVTQIMSNLKFSMEIYSHLLFYHYLTFKKSLFLSEAKQIHSIL